MSHYRDYIVSYGKKVDEPWTPDEVEFNEQVKSDYCEIEDLPKKDLLDSFVTFLDGILPDIPHAIKGSVLKDGTVKVKIPKGCIRSFLRKEVKRIKECADGLTEDDYFVGIHRLNVLTSYLDPYTTVFVEIYEGGEEDYDTYRRSLIQYVEDNDKEDTAVYVYGSIDHHI